MTKLGEQMIREMTLRGHSVNTQRVPAGRFAARSALRSISESDLEPRGYGDPYRTGRGSQGSTHRSLCELSRNSIRPSDSLASFGRGSHSQALLAPPIQRPTSGQTLILPSKLGGQHARLRTRQFRRWITGSPSDRITRGKTRASQVTRTSSWYVPWCTRRLRLLPLGRAGFACGRTNEISWSHRNFSNPNRPAVPGRISSAYALAMLRCTQMGFCIELQPRCVACLSSPFIRVIGGRERKP